MLCLFYFANKVKTKDIKLCLELILNSSFRDLLYKSLDVLTSCFDVIQDYDVKTSFLGGDPLRPPVVPLNRG